MPGVVLRRFYARLAAECGVVIPVDATFRKLRPGHWQRSAGAYSWEIVGVNGVHLLAGYESATKLLRAEVLTVKRSYHHDLICDGHTPTVPAPQSRPGRLEEGG